jgi:magnesium transporter
MTETDEVRGEPRFRAVSWDETLIEHKTLNDALAAIKAGKVTWVDLLGRTDENERLLGVSGLDIHPLIIEDVFMDCVRPKIEDYRDYVYVLFHAPSPTARDDDPDTLDLVELDILLGQNYLVTHHAQPSRALDEIWKDALRTQKAIKRGSAWLSHSVLDRVVDDYIPLLDRIDDEIGTLEHEVLSDSGKDVLKRIFAIKRQLQQLRRVAIHQKEVLYRLSRGEFDEIPEPLVPFFRDVYDHFARVSDLADSYRELINGTFEAHLSVQSNKMNQIMKTLTLATTIFMPLSFIAGIYGMNFEDMPELKKPGAYFGTLVFMGVLAVVILLIYRRKKWL